MEVIKIVVLTGNMKQTPVTKKYDRLQLHIENSKINISLNTNVLPTVDRHDFVKFINAPVTCICLKNMFIENNFQLFVIYTHHNFCNDIISH